MFKKIILLVLVAGSITHTSAAEIDSNRFNISLGSWNAKVIDRNNFYPTYLADPLGVRFEVNAQTVTYGDIDMSDKVNDDGSYLGKLVIIPGVRFSLFKFSPKYNPNLGVELDLGFSTPVFMRAGNHDLIGVDGVYYFAVAARVTDWMALRFSKHHICTHVGDEYWTGGTSSPIDFDPNVTQLPVRDDFIASVALRPFGMLNMKQFDFLQVYGDFGFFWPGSDFLGSRQNKPSKHAFLNYQYGAELEYYFRQTYLGGFYAAYNVSAYQNLAFAPNTNINVGYIVPQERNENKLRLGINWYSGRPLSNQFQFRKEKFVAFSLAMDI